MIRIRFPDEETELYALGWLAGRFSYKTFDTGVTLVPSTALAALAQAGIHFTAEGPATYDQLEPGAPAVRNTAA